MPQYNNCNQCNNQNCDSIYVTGAETAHAMDITNNKARYYAELAETYKNEAKEFRDTAQYYAEQNSDVTMSYIDSLEVALKDLIDEKQDALVSNTNIKTINSASLLGAGNISVADTFLSNVSSIDGGSVVAGTSLANLTDVGEKHFINKQQISNCLLEIPNRIQYTLVEGTLTVKAGSVLLIPYGTTDQSSTINVGDTFINSNLKVTETYWDSTNSLFYVWVELQNDFAQTTPTAGSFNRLAFLSFSDSEMIFSVLEEAKVISVSSDSAVTLTTALFYNTTENLVKQKNSGTITTNAVTFPFLLTSPNATYDVAQVKQVFNGFGYIGSVIWADKGIKGLIPNGKNADGTLKNTEFAITQPVLYDISAQTTGGKVIRIKGNTLDLGNAWYNPDDNYNYSSDDYGTKIDSKICLTLSYDNTTHQIDNFRILPILNFNSMIGGNWVNKSQTIAQSVTYPTSTSTSYSLDNYLPKDGYSYEVLLSGSVTTGSTSGDLVNLSVSTNIIAGSVLLCGARTRSSSSVGSAGNAIIPVNYAREVIVNANSNATGTYNLYARGYRRLGIKY